MNNNNPDIEKNNFDEQDDRIFLEDITPESITPKFEAVRSKDEVPFVNEDGEQWPDMLIELYENSALHRAIIQSVSEQVAGKGFTWDSSAAGSDLLTLWSKNINNEGEDINELLWKVTDDFIIHNGFSVLVNWSKDWTKIISTEHVDFSKVRANKVNPIGKVESYWYCWDWTKQRTPKINIPVFNLGSANENKKAYEKAVEKGNNEELQKAFLKPTTQIFYYKPYTPGKFYYPLPKYNGALAAIKTDILSDGYGLSAFESGLNASMIVTLFGLQGDARRKAVKKFEKMYEGPRGKRTVYHFANKSEEAIKIDKIDQNKADGVYTSVNENTLQKILSSHKVTDPIIVGVATPGGFGESEKIKAAINFWNSSVIIPLQQEVVKVFNKFMGINQFPSLSIEPIDLLPEKDMAETENVNADINNKNV